MVTPLLNSTVYKNKFVDLSLWQAPQAIFWNNSNFHIFLVGLRREAIHPVYFFVLALSGHDISAAIARRGAGARCLALLRSGEMQRLNHSAKAAIAFTHVCRTILRLRQAQDEEIGSR